MTPSAIAGVLFVAPEKEQGELVAADAERLAVLAEPGGDLGEH